MRGLITNIQRFSLHDGPGIRTTVFLKGCPLSCRWCQNPETIDPRPELMRQPTGELGWIGVERTTRDIIAEVGKDSEYFKQSGGGLTLSGGEPLYQAEFCFDLARRAKKAGWSVVLDTSGYAEEEQIEKMAGVVDLFLFDIKILDDGLHKRFTGRSNQLILQNLRRLIRLKKPVEIRVPLVPGITDTPENLAGIEALVLKLDGEIKIVRIPFNPLMREKYRLLGREANLSEGAVI